MPPPPAVIGFNKVRALLAVVVRRKYVVNGLRTHYCVNIHLTAGSC